MNSSAPKLGWGHININVSDLDRSIEFYEKLGFEVFLPGIPYLALDSGDEPQALAVGMENALGVEGTAQGRACIMQLGDGFPKIDLTEYVGLEQGAPLTNSDLGLVRLCLSSNNLETDVARLQSQGVEFLSAPTTAANDLAEVALCRDPDGTLIELLQVHIERWQPYLDHDRGA